MPCMCGAPDCPSCGRAQGTYPAACYDCQTCWDDPEHAPVCEDCGGRHCPDCGGPCPAAPDEPKED